ncbi:MAG: hypothetical protein V2A54_03260 [Bacteroidota bacterium]
MAKTTSKNPDPDMDMNLNTTGETTTVSKLDLLSGKHTTGIIVAILFIVTFFGLLYLECNKPDLSKGLETGLVGLLGVFAGFYAGTTLQKK